MLPLLPMTVRFDGTYFEDLELLGLENATLPDFHFAL